MINEVSHDLVNVHLDLNLVLQAEPAVHLAVKAHAPNLIQFEGWVHRFKDMDRYMRQKGYGAHAVGYFKVNLFSKKDQENLNYLLVGLCKISSDVRVSRRHDRQVPEGV